jgi:hypothetical protein
MANTFELISSYTATGSVANITFSSIPSTYTDLVLDCSLRSDRAGDSDGTKLTFNGSTSGYTNTILYGSGSAASSFSGNTDSIGNNYTSSNFNASNIFGNMCFYIPNYAGSTNKSVSVDAVGEANATYAEMDLLAGLWSNTDAITSVSIKPNIGSNFVIYSTAYLYGVKNA